MGFLYSATAPAYLSVLLAWLLGGALGCWLPEGLQPRWLFWLAGLACWGNCWALWRGSIWGSWLLAGILGGIAGSYWLCHCRRSQLQRLLFFESLGMAAGFSVSHGLIYTLGIKWILSVPALSILLTAWEGCHEENASYSL